MFNYLQNTQPTKIVEIPGITERVRRRETTYSESNQTFIWTDYPQVKALVKITMEGGEAGMVYAALRLFPTAEQVRGRRRKPKIRPIPTVSYLLRDRVNGGSGESQNVLRSTYAEFGCRLFNFAMGFGCQLFPKDWLLSPTYNVSDAVEMDVFVETNAAARRIYSNDGSLRWTIESWSRVRGNLLNGLVDSHRSLYFYTYQGGYRVQAWVTMRPRAVANGAEENVVVTIVFLTGVHDRHLTKRYPHSTTVTLKNPRHPDQIVVSQSVERGQARRYQLVFPAERIPFDRLLADDSFLLQVVISAN